MKLTYESRDFQFHEKDSVYPCLSLAWYCHYHGEIVNQELFLYRHTKEGFIDARVARDNYDGPPPTADTAWALCEEMLPLLHAEEQTDAALPTL